MVLARYLARKIGWTLIVFFVALVLNFLLPRLIPGNPVDAIVGQLAAGGGTGGEQLQQVHEHFMAEFGLDKPLWQQFIVYVGHVLTGDFGTSFGQYPASVNSLIANALPWSVADRKSTRLNSSHANISYAVFCLKKKNLLSVVID